MRILVAGAGPTGLLTAAALARRDHDVLVVDPDPGPPPRAAWRRRGVMQFGHAHGFRPQVGQVLGRRWPEALQAWRCLGAVELDLGPLGGCVTSRRVTLERALRCAAADVPRLTVRAGRVQGLVEDGGRVTGARVDGTVVAADLVVDASGRASRLGGTVARPGVSVDGDCGIAYVNRTYRLRAGAGPGPTNSPIGWSGSFDGYLVLLFPHEAGHFSVVVVRPTANAGLADLRRTAVFDAVARAVPALAEWTDPARSRPTGEVSVGGRLRNVYRSQRALPGLVAVGDTVSTTTPTAGRGIAMSYLQVDALLDLLDQHDAPEVAGPFGAWCDREVLPWVEDHVRNDAAAVRRWQGGDVDLGAPLASDLVVAAADAEPALGPLVGPYLAMAAPPSSLDAAQPLARAVYARGWRPPTAPGPDAAEVVAIARRVLADGRPDAGHRRPLVTDGGRRSG